jgi:hypothetical protein
MTEIADSANRSKSYMLKKEGLSLWRSVLSGIAGALVFHLSCNLLFWLVSFGPSITDVLKFALIEAASALIVGAFVGLLCYRYGVGRSFWVAVITMFLALLTAFFASEYLGVPMSTSSVARNMLVYSMTVLVAGFAVALLLIGLIVAVQWSSRKGPRGSSH